MTPPRRRELLPYLLVAPVLIGVLVVHVIPVLVAIFLSFRLVNQFNLGTWTDAEFLGLENYRTVLDPTTPAGRDLWTSLGVTVSFTAVVVLLCWGIGMFGAVILSQPFRGRNLFRAFFLIPFAIPTYVSAIGWRTLFRRDEGAVNTLLVDDLNLLDDRPFWLVGDNAFWAAVVVAVWRLWPFVCLILLAATSSVPQERYETAASNGAGGWAQFRHVTLPGLRGVNTVLVVVLSLWTFNEFALPYVLFGGNPPKDAALLASVIYREALGTYNIGLAAAAGVSSALVVSVPGALWLWRRRSSTEVDR